MNALLLLWSLDFVKVTHYCRSYAAAKDKRCHTLCTVGAHQHPSPLCKQPQPNTQHGNFYYRVKTRSSLEVSNSSRPAAPTYMALSGQTQASILMALGSIRIRKDSWSKRMQNKTLFSFLFHISLVFINSYKPTLHKILICHSMTVLSTVTTGVYSGGVHPPQQLTWFFLFHPFKPRKLNPR